MKIDFLEKNSEYSWFAGHDCHAYTYYKKFAESYLHSRGYKATVEFDYIRSPLIDAVINTQNSPNLKLYITEGTLLRIYEFFYKLNICTEICKYNFICDKSDQIGCKLVSQDDLNRKIEVDFYICKDKRINAIAEYMAMFATKFVILHELGHYLNGHCDYAISNGRNNFCFHLNDKIDNSLTPIQSQALEVDADCYAACFLRAEADHMCTQNDYIFSLVESKLDVYKLFAAGIQGVCCLMDIDNKNSTTHPMAHARGVLCIDGACRQFPDHKYNYKEEMYKIIAEVCNFSNIMNDKDKDAFANSLKNYVYQAQKIEDCWKTDMYYKVRPFALSPISNM